MDPRNAHWLTKLRSGSLSRRAALRHLGGGGLAAGSGLLLSRAPVRAQANDLEASKELARRIHDDIVAVREATPAAGGPAPSGPVKVVILYNPPADPAAFDAYYLNEHLPLAQGIPGYLRLELARVVATADGGPAPYHRVSELLFPDLAALQAALASPAGQAALADQANFAQAGAVALIAAVDVSEGPGGAATPTP